jgi:arylsulfatase A-like enzyme
MHVVDMLPTLAALAGTPVAVTQPLDGMDVWQAVAAAQPSPREDMVYNIEPGQGAIRVGDWKLHWIPTLPPLVELFDLAADPGESTNLADVHPEIVADLQERVVDLARSMAPPLLFASAIGTTFSAPLATPIDP